MPKFRKKPIEIEAIQFTPEWDGVKELRFRATERTGDTCAGYDVYRDERGPFLLIGTLEGTMRAEPGDWIITGVQGEQYPCKPDIFAATYEPVGP